jgi:hypothetical protein
VAFTSDAKAKWAKDWIAWDHYRQFWSQIAQWSLRRVDNADFTTDVTIDRGEALVSVEAIDNDGNYRNFLNLQTTVVSPKGEKQLVRLEQTGPGRFEARFPTKEIGAYMMNVAELKEGKVRASQALGASVNYSPEFASTEPNLNLMRRLAEAGGGKVLDGSENPFLLNRKKTYQPLDLWESCLKLAILLFVLDVAIRRILLDHDTIHLAWAWSTSWVPAAFMRKQASAISDPAMEALRQRRDEIRARSRARSAAASPVDAWSTPPASAGENRPASSAESTPFQSQTPAPEPPSSDAPPAVQPADLSSRLLAARRNALKNRSSSGGKETT